jgi:hypothetical protein
MTVNVQVDGDSRAFAAMHPVPWEIREASGPVIVAAIHAGHDVSPGAARHLIVEEQDRYREEDPLTDFCLGLGDTSIRVNRSRFEVDLNRPRQRAVATDPADTWGVRIWDGAPPAEVVEESLRLHRSFYETVGALLDESIARWGQVLVLDVHSYNHRRDGPGTEADPAGNPDIDLGVTTLDRERFGALLRRFTEALGRCSVGGRALDVRENVKYDGGGHFPEWLHRRHPTTACVISLEYKKVFMDEWTGMADVAALNALRASLALAIAAAREELARCR